MAAVLEPVVTPQHTCILVNTTNTLGVESYLQQRYPTNVILSLVCNVEISQIAASEFEHLNSTEIWVGYAKDSSSTISSSVQKDMALAFATTMSSGQVDCKVSTNIRQEQFERMIGWVLLLLLLYLSYRENPTDPLSTRPIAFHPANVIFNTPDNSKLLKMVGVRQLVSEVIDELLELASADGCPLPKDFRQKTISQMLESDSHGSMYQDFVNGRPMEVETYLGSPIKLATAAGIRVPRIETLYAMLYHFNAVAQNKEPPYPNVISPPRVPSAPPSQRPPVNGAMRPPPRTASSSMMPPPRRGTAMNPMSRPPGPPGPPRTARDPSLEALEEFSHLVVYGDGADGAVPNGNGNPYPNMPPGTAAEIAYKERELALRERELQMQQQEMQMQRGGGRRGPPRPRSAFGEPNDGYFNPMSGVPPVPPIDPDSVDMMSITSRRARRHPSAAQMRRNPELCMNNSRPGSSFSRYMGGGGRKSASDRIVQEIPSLHDSLLDNPMMSYSSDRFGAVDRRQLNAESRANSLTPSRAGDYPPSIHGFPPASRRNSQTTGNPFGPPPGRGMGRPMPPNDPNLMPANGVRRGQPSPPGNMRPPNPRYPSGPGNNSVVGPQQSEQPYGVSNPHHPAKSSPNNKSLTGSASASAGSADSGNSANNQRSGHSSQASIGAHHAAMPLR